MKKLLAIFILSMMFIQCNENEPEIEIKSNQEIIQEIKDFSLNHSQLAWIDFQDAVFDILSKYRNEVTEVDDHNSRGRTELDLIFSFYDGDCFWTFWDDGVGIVSCGPGSTSRFTF